MFTRIVVFESEKREKVSLEISKLDAADAAGLNLAVLEEEHGRDVADTVFCNDFRILVDVDLADNHAAAYFSASSSITGPSLMQGPHHVAQKSSTTTLPEAIASFAVWSLNFSAIVLNVYG